jgi:uncharacterized OB-fold protein
MEQFLNNLKGSRFAIPYCIRCNSPSWPPIERCNICMSRVKLKRIKTPVGHLIEHTTAYNMSKPVIFGVIELDGIKLVGSLHSVAPYVGMGLRMINCGVSADGTPFYEFEEWSGL